KCLKNTLPRALYWQADYQAFGERVAKLFWSNTRFAYLYGLAMGGGGENVRLRFNLERPLFGGLWGAMFDSFSQRHIILDSTITRRARQSGLLNPFAAESADAGEVATRIGSDQRDLNILVIKSNLPDGSAPEGPDDPLWEEYWESCRKNLPKNGLEQLEHFDDEVRELQGLGSWTRRTARGAAPDGVKVDVLALPEPCGETRALA